MARFEEVADPELRDRVELLAYRDHGLKVVKTTVTGFGWVDLAPRYAFAGFELADAPGPGFSGSPVLDERGRVLGISTQTRRDGDTERGMAMQLGQVMPLAQRNDKPERGHGMSANSGEEIYNRCIVEGTGRDGQPLQVERYAGQQPGAVAFSEVVPSPSFLEPQLRYEHDGLERRDARHRYFDTGPAAGSLAAHGTGLTTLAGTFKRGVTYIITFRAQVPGGLPQIVVGVGVSGDRAERTILARQPGRTALDPPCRCRMAPVERRSGSSKPALR